MNIFLVFYHPVNDAKQQIQKGEMVLEVCIYFMNILEIFYEYFLIFYEYFTIQRNVAKPEIKKRKNSKKFAFILLIFYEYLKNISSPCGRD